MSRTNERIRESRRLAAGLGLSGAALAGLIYFEGLSTRAEEWWVEDDVDDLAAFTADDADEPGIVARAPVAEATVVAVAEVEVAAPEPLGPALVVVPDIERMGVREATKRLAAVGLKLAVRDDYGNKIPRMVWGSYEVRTQKIEAGTEVAPGSTVKAKAREIVRYAAGY